MVSSACLFFNFKVPKDNHFIFLSSKINGTQELHQHHGSMSLSFHLAPPVCSQWGIHNPSRVPCQGRLGHQRDPHICASEGGWVGPHGGSELRGQCWNWGNSGSGYTCDPCGRAGRSWRICTPKYRYQTVPIREVKHLCYVTTCWKIKGCNSQPVELLKSSKALPK